MYMDDWHTRIPWATFRSKDSIAHIAIPSTCWSQNFRQSFEARGHCNNYFLLCFVWDKSGLLKTTFISYRKEVTALFPFATIVLWANQVIRLKLHSNLTTSLRRTLSPVCQQNVKRCNKCIKHSWRVHCSAAKSKLSCFCAYFGDVNFDDFGQKEQNACQDAHLGRLGFPNMYKSLLQGY